MTESSAENKDKIVGPAGDGAQITESVSNPLPPGEYRVSAHTGDDTSESPDAVTDLVVEEPDSDNIDIFRSPIDHQTSADSFYSQTGTGITTETEYIIPGEELILSIESPLMAGIILSEDPENQITEKPDDSGPASGFDDSFFESISGRNSPIEFQIESTDGTNYADRLDTSNTDVFIGDNFDYLFIVINTDGLELSQETDSGDLNVGIEVDTKTSKVTFPTENLGLEEPQATVDQIQLTSPTNITGTSNLAPGTKLDLEINGLRGRSLTSATVAPDSRFKNTFESSLVVQSDADVRIYGPQDIEINTQANIVEPPPPDSSDTESQTQADEGPSDTDNQEQTEEDTSDSESGSQDSVGESSDTINEDDSGDNSNSETPPFETVSDDAESIISSITTHFAFSVLVAAVSFSMGGAVYVYWIRG